MKENSRPPIGLERMLRIHLIQHWFKLADFACEESLYDSASLRRFIGIDLECEAVPGAITMRKFRDLLEERKLGEKLFAEAGRASAATATGANRPCRRWCNRRRAASASARKWAAKSSAAC